MVEVTADNSPALKAAEMKVAVKPSKVEAASPWAVTSRSKVPTIHDSVSPLAVKSKVPIAHDSSGSQSDSEEGSLGLNSATEESLPFSAKPPM
jgi:hypothetical protein